LGLVGIVAAAVGASYLSYSGVVADAVDPPVDVTIESGRAGLVMQPGALVKMHGVEVGKVTAVRQTADGAEVDIRLAASEADTIPANVDADIAATTIFGAKYVTLVDPADPGTRPIATGARIDAGSVTVEVNSVFESLTTVLAAVDPQKFNSTLTALATAFRGRGAELGRTIDDTNSLLATLEPSIPALRKDITSTADTANVYAEAAPDLLATLGNLSTTADTIVQKKDTLDGFLLSAIGLGDTGNAVLSDNSAALSDVIHTLRPTAILTNEYSPMITCFLQGADVARGYAEKVSGGNGRTMLLNSTILFGVPPYTYEKDLPEVAASGGPRCGDLPVLGAEDVPAPYVVADTGSNPFRAGNTGPVLSPSSILDFLPGGLAAPGAAR
jgi:phospholipid/cholesterol/gamma-HCH transport system substrate-binding protein